MVQQPDENLTSPYTCRPGVTALAGSTSVILGVASMVALIAFSIQLGSWGSGPLGRHDPTEAREVSTMIRGRMVRLALLVVVGMTIGCDQISEHLAAEQLMGVARQSFLDDTLRLEYAESAGAWL